MRKLRKGGAVNKVQLQIYIFLYLPHSRNFSRFSLSHSKVGGRIPEKPFAEDVRAACCGFSPRAASTPRSSLSRRTPTGARARLRLASQRPQSSISESDKSAPVGWKA